MTRRSWTIVALAAAAVTGLAACSPAETENQARQPSIPRPDLIATEAQDGGIVPLYPGQELEVRLHGNATIDPPLEWAVASIPPNLGLIARNIVPDDPEADGAGATWVFRFRAIREGEGRLTFAGGASRRRVSMEVISDNEMIID